MFEKNLNIAFLLDFYGEVLTENTRQMLEMYYCDDLSLSEIAGCVGISRQGVRHAIKKGEEELSVLEQKLGLAGRHLALSSAAEHLLSAADEASLAPSDEERVARLISYARSCATMIVGNGTVEGGNGDV